MNFFYYLKSNVCAFFAYCSTESCLLLIILRIVIKVRTGLICSDRTFLHGWNSQWVLRGQIICHLDFRPLAVISLIHWTVMIFLTPDGRRELCCCSGYSIIAVFDEIRFSNFSYLPFPILLLSFLDLVYSGINDVLLSSQEHSHFRVVMQGLLISDRCLLGW